VVFVLDISGSTRDTHLLSRDFAADVIYGLDVGSGAARVGTVAYSSKVVGQTYLGDRVGNREAIVNALRLYSTGRGTTNTAAALDVVRTEQLTTMRGSRTNVPKASQRTVIYRLVVRDYVPRVCMELGLCPPQAPPHRRLATTALQVIRINLS